MVSSDRLILSFVFTFKGYVQHSIRTNCKAVNQFCITDDMPNVPTVANRAIPQEQFTDLYQLMTFLSSLFNMNHFHLLQNSRGTHLRFPALSHLIHLERSMGVLSLQSNLQGACLCKYLERDQPNLWSAWNAELNDKEKHTVI